MKSTGKTQYQNMYQEWVRWLCSPATGSSLLRRHIVTRSPRAREVLVDVLCDLNALHSDDGEETVDKGAEQETFYARIANLSQRIPESEEYAYERYRVELGKVSVDALLGLDPTLPIPIELSDPLDTRYLANNTWKSGAKHLHDSNRADGSRIQFVSLDNIRLEALFKRSIRDFEPATADATEQRMDYLKAFPLVDKFLLVLDKSPSMAVEWAAHYPPEPEELMAYLLAVGRQSPLSKGLLENILNYEPKDEGEAVQVGRAWSRLLAPRYDWVPALASAESEETSRLWEKFVAITKDYPDSQGPDKFLAMECMVLQHPNELSFLPLLKAGWDPKRLHHAFGDILLTKNEGVADRMWRLLEDQVRLTPEVLRLYVDRGSPEIESLVAKGLDLNCQVLKRTAQTPANHYVWEDLPGSKVEATIPLQHCLTREQATHIREWQQRNKRLTSEEKEQDRCEVELDLV